MVATMIKTLTYAIGFAFAAFAFATFNWYIETSIAAGTIANALLTLIFATVGIGLLLLNHRAKTKREIAREKRWRAAEDRARIAEEREAYYRERAPWN